MSTILVALDTSDRAQPVVENAKSFAERMNSRIVLLHVVEPIASYVPVGATMDVITTSPDFLDAGQTEAAQKRLEEIAASLRAGGLEVEAKTTMGIAVDEILEEARASGVSCIILGSHGHGALFHLFSGSVVTGVLKHTPCPVLVVPVRETN